ncbi:MAG: hypothetical protein ABSA74_02290 [Candidatus Staskawiczbacteria bacterium]
MMAVVATLVALVVVSGCGNNELAVTKARLEDAKKDKAKAEQALAKKEVSPELRSLDALDKENSNVDIVKPMFGTTTISAQTGLPANTVAAGTAKKLDWEGQAELETVRVKGGNSVAKEQLNLANCHIVWLKNRISTLEKAPATANSAEISAMRAELAGLTALVNGVGSKVDGVGTKADYISTEMYNHRRNVERPRPIYDARGCIIGYGQ